ASADPSQVRIQGNYLGVSLNGTTALFNKLGNIGDFNAAPAFNASVVGQYAPAAGTYVRSGAKVTVTLARHGQATGQTLWLAFSAGTGTAPVAKQYAITVIDNDTFSVTVPTGPAGSGLVTVMNMLRITMPENHGLLSGHRLWLEFTNASGSKPASQALSIGRVSQSDFVVVVPSTAMPTFGSGTVAVKRYGGTKAQLVATNQRDYEGNLHGVSSVGSTTGGTGTGGVIPSAPTPGRPVLGPPRT
ncbi:MAG: hypothetical protein ACKOSQ_10425, partial [Planctomycetaceae bacterium]